MQPKPSERQRAYILVGVDGPADANTVAELFDRAADSVRSLGGPVVIQGMTYEHDDDNRQASCTLTLYYDRLERRRTVRP